MWIFPRLRCETGLHPPTNRGYEARRNGLLAQLVERFVYTEDVGSSSLSQPTTAFRIPPMPNYPEIFVIRHGQTLWNSQKRYQGRMNSPLTDTGRAQATAVGTALRAALAGREVAYFASPQGRAQETATHMGVQPTPDARLAEVSFGAWEGLNWDDIAAGWPERAAMAETEPFLWNFQAPGGETLADLQARAGDFLDSLTGPSVLVTHGITSKVLRAAWLGLNEYETASLAGGQGVIFHLSQPHGQRSIETEFYTPSQIA